MTPDAVNEVLHLCFLFSTLFLEVRYNFITIGFQGLLDAG